MESFKKFLSAFSRFASSWTGTIIIVLFLIFFVAQSFVIPSGSMKRTQLIGDFLFAKKFSYGIPTPHLPWLEVPILPDFNDNGHLIEGPRPQREEIVIFRNPKTPKIHFVKRCVAIGGDEILFDNKKLYIHFHNLTDETSIKNKYPDANIVKLNNKLWVLNPYMSTYPGIQYKPEYNSNSFELLNAHYQANNPIDMKPQYIEELGKNLFYTKVAPDHYYMVGDNRDNSNDSRFWGAVPYKNIVGKPWLIYMSLEFRSYQKVMHGDQHGSGKDHDKLSRICPQMDIGSSECEALWDKQRYTIRWGRIGRRIDTLQYEQPIE
ncbi:MAG: Signal peptidase I (EC [uncultured Sulfurovum sp.]|uniref:Signal peptidase I n=1 Tax=uncultured Sulfurovum sp. TaxID=269237 RepID=A0A6S6UGV2_9BACT|nr:MAG: Signal peptidase I (EC [uncultured Sulfurovum sp.]